MPYVYELTLAEGEPERRLAQQLVPAGSLVGTGEAVALLTDGVMEFQVPAPRQGLLVMWHVESGAAVDDVTAIARIVCEGEETPVPDAVPVRLG